MDQTLHERADLAIAKLKQEGHSVEVISVPPDGTLAYLVGNGHDPFKLSMQQVAELGEGHLTFAALEERARQEKAEKRSKMHV